MVVCAHIRAGWLIDGTGGPIRRDVVLLVKSGRIRSICGAADLPVRVPCAVDLSRCTVVPGLIDSHVHLFMSGTDDPEVRRRQLNAPFEEAARVILSHLRQQLTHGVTAVRDGGDYGGYSLRFKRECMPLDNTPICVRSPGKAWRAPGRYGRLIGRPPLEGERLVEALSRECGETDHVKIVNSGLNSLLKFGRETPPQFGPDELREAVRAAKARGLGVMVHANGRLPVRWALEAGCTSVEHGFFMGRENLGLMAERQIIWVPTAYTMKAYAGLHAPGSRESDTARRNLDHQLEQLARAWEYGVPVALGTDCGSPGVHHGTAVAEEMKLLLQAGFTLEGAVRCATRNGAAALGMKGALGALMPGMPATFVAFKGNPGALADGLSAPGEIFLEGRQWRPEGTEAAGKEISAKARFQGEQSRFFTRQRKID